MGWPMRKLIREARDNPDQEWLTCPLGTICHSKSDLANLAAGPPPVPELRRPRLFAGGFASSQWYMNRFPAPSVFKPLEAPSPKRLTGWGEYGSDDGSVFFRVIARLLALDGWLGGWFFAGTHCSTVFIREGVAEGLFDFPDFSHGGSIKLYLEAPVFDGLRAILKRELKVEAEPHETIKNLWTISLTKEALQAHCLYRWHGPWWRTLHVSILPSNYSLENFLRDKMPALKAKVGIRLNPETMHLDATVWCRALDRFGLEGFVDHGPKPKEETKTSLVKWLTTRYLGASSDPLLTYL